MTLRFIPGWLALILVVCPAHAQNVPVDQVCEVTSTRLGRWYNVTVACGDDDRVRVQLPETLRSCPPIAGDRVRVRSMNEDGTSGLVVTGFESRVLGEWCANPVGPVTLTGPCYIEEDPPRDEREEQLGAKWTRAVVTTWVRWYDDGRRSIGPGGCSPLRLSHGAYRLYVSEAVRTGVWGPCPTGVVPGPTGLCLQATNEEAWYEGGVAVDSTLAELPAQSAAAFVPGWEEDVPGEEEAAIRFSTKPLSFAGLRLPVRIRTTMLGFSGGPYPFDAFPSVRLRTGLIGFRGYRLPVRFTTLPISFGGMLLPVRIRTSTLTFEGT